METTSKEQGSTIMRPTALIKWRKKPFNEEPLTIGDGHVLQQKWIYENGEEIWVDVPSEEGPKFIVVV